MWPFNWKTFNDSWILWPILRCFGFNQLLFHTHARIHNPRCFDCTVYSLQCTPMEWITMGSLYLARLFRIFRQFIYHPYITFYHIDSIELIGCSRESRKIVIIPANDLLLFNFHRHQRYLIGWHRNYETIACAFRFHRQSHAAYVRIVCVCVCACTCNS